MLRAPEPKLNEFIENYQGKISRQVASLVEGGKDRFIFNGPAGSGKSFLADALANSIGGNVETINLYLLENVDDTDISSLALSTISNAVQSKSLFDSGRKVVFVEDIEKLLSVNPKILSKIRDLNGAIIIFESSTGEIFRGKNKAYVSGYEVIRLYKLNDGAALSFARRVLALNKKTLPEQTLIKIVKNARGNLSSIMTDLNLAITLGKEGHISPRNSEDSIFEQLNGIFSGKAITGARFSSDNEAKNFEIWVSDKAPQVFTGERLLHVYEKLSLADTVLNKIRKQNWSLLKYVQNMLFYGVASLSSGKPVSVTYYAPRWDIYYKH